MRIREWGAPGPPSDNGPEFVRLGRRKPCLSMTAGPLALLEKISRYPGLTVQQLRLELTRHYGARSLRLKDVRQYAERCVKSGLSTVELGDDGHARYRPTHKELRVEVSLNGGIDIVETKAPVPAEPPVEATALCAHDFEPETQICRRCKGRLMRLWSTRNGRTISGLYWNIEARS
jgi:hypothetical protein